MRTDTQDASGIDHTQPHVLNTHKSILQDTHPLSVRISVTHTERAFRDLVQCLSVGFKPQNQN